MATIRCTIMSDQLRNRQTCANVCPSHHVDPRPAGVMDSPTPDTCAGLEINITAPTSCALRRTWGPLLGIPLQLESRLWHGPHPHSSVGLSLRQQWQRQGQRREPRGLATILRRPTAQMRDDQPLLGTCHGHVRQSSLLLLMLLRLRKRGVALDLFATRVEHLDLGGGHRQKTVVPVRHEYCWPLQSFRGMDRGNANATCGPRGATATPALPALLHRARCGVLGVQRHFGSKVLELQPTTSPAISGQAVQHCLR
mmetsp:Transcript_48352/g.122711  ORF Transcript_48352/g.122711 Transcript_48352/m.122711 type:complete len:254 (-) Transcript_48352:227-988(-)